MGAQKIWKIGRDEQADIKINSKNVSRDQAEIVFENGVYFLVNLSKHKTSFIKRGNDKIKVQRQKIESGDLLFFADQGPFNLESLIDEDKTMIDFKVSNSGISSANTDPRVGLDEIVEKKRCGSCASIIAKTLDKCPECGSLT